MKFKQMIFWMTVFLVYIMATRISVDSDTWWHLRAGRWMIENRRILTVDLFSYTRYGAEWRYPGWLIELPMAWLEAHFGLGGLNLLSGILIATTFAFVFATTYGNELFRAFLVILAATASGIYWSARPHLMTLLFTAISLYLLERSIRNGVYPMRRMLLLSLPALMLCWVNMHGGFIVGFILWGIYFTDRLIEQLVLVWSERRRFRDILGDETLRVLALVGLGMVVCANFNPLWVRIFLYPFQTISIQKLKDHIQEWQSPDFHLLSVQPFIWLLLLLLFVSAISRKRWTLRDFLLISAFLYMAFYAARNIALFAIIAPLPISRIVEDVDLKNLRTKVHFGKWKARSQDSSKDYPYLNLFFLGIVFLGCVFRSSLAYRAEIVWRHLSSFYPLGAVRYLKENQPQGRLFNSYNWGGYLLWVLPEYPVFVDGRTDLYNDEVLDQWLQVVQLKEGWEQVLDQWRIRLILMEKDWIMAKALQQNGWCERYQDETAVLLEKCQ